MRRSSVRFCARWIPSLSVPVVSGSTSCATVACTLQTSRFSTSLSPSKHSSRVRQSCDLPGRCHSLESPQANHTLCEGNTSACSACRHKLTRKDGVSCCWCPLLSLQHLAAGNLLGGEGKRSLLQRPIQHLRCGPPDSIGDQASLTCSNKAGPPRV